MNNETLKRDELAKKRTNLANERTLLAYIRTSLALTGLGIFLIKYEPTEWSVTFGAASVIIAVVLGIAGTLRFFLHQKHIDNF